MQTEFAFNLGDKVTIDTSGESGQVVGRAEYLHCEPSYFLRYTATDGRAVEQWWAQSALSPAA